MPKRDWENTFFSPRSENAKLIELQQKLKIIGQENRKALESLGLKPNPPPVDKIEFPTDEESAITQLCNMVRTNPKS